ncbi:MAG: aminotransferase class I/II-fold pyridoxal phosphate-dependent enzyme [Clostridia bacterium]|nr:aminotransferase class I/II-fold pyridoxal phosphate-dependent enzyme [Clostridia bacterium]
MKLNEGIKLLPGSAATVKNRVEEFRGKYPSETLIHLDRPWMARPLPDAVRERMESALRDVVTPFGTHLDSPVFGYRSVRAALAERLRRLGVEAAESEIFLFPGAESAHSAFSRLFDRENDVLLPDPGEPYLTTLHRGAGRNLRFLRAMPENDFLPLPEERADLICLSSPNLVTGAAYSADALKALVDRVNEWGSVLIFDASFTAFCPNAPRSIYEIPGARNCAVEIFSFDRAFGAPELKAASLMIPQSLVRQEERLNALFCASAVVSSPPSFISQAAGACFLSEEALAGREAAREEVLAVSRILSEGLTRAAIPHVGEGTSPCVWAQCPGDMSAWQFFDLLLEEANLVVTPGSLYGYSGERFVRLSAYLAPEEAREAVAHLERALKKFRAAPAEPDNADILEP